MLDSARSVARTANTRRNSPSYKAWACIAACRPSVDESLVIGPALTEDADAAARRASRRKGLSRARLGTVTSLSGRGLG